MILFFKNTMFELHYFILNYSHVLSYSLDMPSCWLGVLFSFLIILPNICGPFINCHLNFHQNERGTKAFYSINNNSLFQCQIKMLGKNDFDVNALVCKLLWLR